jgi:hypothetical protein
MKKLLYTIFLVVIISIGISAIGGAAIAQENRDKCKNLDSIWRELYALKPDKDGWLGQKWADDAEAAWNAWKSGDSSKIRDTIPNLDPYPYTYSGLIDMIKLGYPEERAKKLMLQNGYKADAFYFINSNIFTVSIRDSLYAYYKQYPEYFNDSVYKKFLHAKSVYAINNIYENTEKWEAKMDSLWNEIQMCLPPEGRILL